MIEIKMISNKNEFDVEIYVGKRNRFGVNIGYGGKKDGLFY
jgi:glycine cleavage system pyridoxal-binding protein P